MKNLSPNTVLQRIPDLRMRVDSTGGAQIFTDHGAVECGSHCLAVLDAFSRPVSLAVALEELTARARGTQDWRDLTSTIVRLYESGVLRDGNRAELALKTETNGFDAAQVHVEMLNDETRTSRYLKAIRETVRAGDVVVDVGTGTGVLAVAAAQAGARRVYAIEASGIGDCAEAVFQANDVGERITLLRGWSTQVQLPERADVLVSEIIGNDPLAEHVVEMTADALKRFVKQDARLVPRKLNIYGMLACVPRDELMRRTFTPEATGSWRSRYNVNFAPLAEAAARSPLVFYIKPAKTREWNFLSEPFLLAEVDLQSARHLLIETSVSAVALRDGLLNGIVVFFDLELSAETNLRTHPAEVDESCSWRSPVWLLVNPSNVRAGERFNVSYRHGAPETQAVLSVERA